GGEPIGGRDVTGHRERHSSRTRARAAQDHGQQAERGNEFAENDRPTTAHMLRSRKPRQTKHEMSDQGPENSASALRCDVERRFTPGHSMIQCFRERNGGGEEGGGAWSAEQC